MVTPSGLKHKNAVQAKLQTNSSISECAKKPTKAKIGNVAQMTSREFQKDPYAHIEVASQCLKDKVVMAYFQAAIMQNKHLFKDRIVLDIGCGLGILSLFAAKAGAAHVYAVDCSSIVDYTRQIVIANGYADVIHVIQGRIEEVELPVQKVDIIVCDWMGYSLLFESICDAVILARNKWLKPIGGLIIPDMAKLYMVAVEDSKTKNNKIDWWHFVYDFKMTRLRNWALREPIFRSIQPTQMISTEYKIMTLDLYKATPTDLKFRSKFRLEIVRSGCFDGICTYFKVFFTKSHTKLVLNTDPNSANTRWTQAVFYFDRFVSANAGSLFFGGIEMGSASVSRKPDLRNMKVLIELYSGEPQLNQIHLRSKMVYQLKPHISVSEKKASTKGKSIVDKAKTKK